MNHGAIQVVRAIRSYREKGGGRRFFNVQCCFEPSCSVYAEQAIARYGFVRGGLIGLRRILRCRERDSIHRTPDPLE